MPADIRQIDRLQAAWARAHPKRARGGSVAIEGFAYQFQSMLRDAVQLWLKDRSSVAPLGEFLSDILQSNGGKWKITQVKCTGTSASLTRALEELWTIDTVARNEIPELVGSLQYEVRCAHWELSNWRKTIDEWLPETPISRTQEAVSDFRKRTIVSSDPHPLNDLLVCLTNQLHVPNPLEWVNTWVGQLTMAAKGEQTPASLGQRLYSDLVGFERCHPDKRLPSGVYLLSVDIKQPDTVEQGPYLVGEQPRPSHLREGYFAPRNWQVTPATQAFLEWLDSNPFGSDRSNRIPIFWISGRSGSGKSVLMLQVLSRLISHGLGPIIWIGNKNPHFQTPWTGPTKLLNEGRRQSLAWMILMDQVSMRIHTKFGKRH